jgi:hypothetical protein
MRSKLVAVATFVVLATGASATCVCSGLDYTNGGSYLIDGASENDFVFTSEFTGMAELRETLILGLISNIDRL